MLAAAATAGSGAAVIALAVRIPLQPLLGDSAVFATFYPAAMLAAWYGGFVSGAVASARATLWRPSSAAPCSESM